MAEETNTDYIDFEEEKAKLWQRAYFGIKCTLILKGLANQRVELPNSETMKSVVLELPDVLVLEDSYGRCGYAEFFEDDDLFDVYKEVMQLRF